LHNLDRPLTLTNTIDNAWSDLFGSNSPLELQRWRAVESVEMKKKKVKRFRAVTAVKELARERVGSPPSEKIVIEKTKKPEKHKPTLGKLLDLE
jgi:hypothetical protein